MPRLLSLVSICTAGLLALVGCGPKVISSDDLSKGTPKAVALLPLNYPSGVQRERVDYLRAALNSELKNRGFVVLDENAVKRVCSTPECPESPQLTSKYLADGFVALHLESIARNNFLAGYYNAISGKLELLNRERKPLLEIQHTESERGGLLFNSGQLIQGVISQINNSDKNAYGKLADKFTQTLVSKIPRPKQSSTEDEGSAVSIKNVKLQRNKAGGDELCVSATPESMAFVLLPRQRSNLREVRPGEYCARLHIEDLATDLSTVSVEVRSPYGSSARQALKSDMGPCDLSGMVGVRAQGSNKRLVLTCGTDSSACDKAHCDAHRYIIYRASNPLGPFTKVAVVKELAWTLPHSGKSADSALYQVVAVDRHGNFSVPTSVDTAG